MNRIGCVRQSTSSCDSASSCVDGKLSSTILNRSANSLKGIAQRFIVSISRTDRMNSCTICNSFRDRCYRCRSNNWALSCIIANRNCIILCCSYAVRWCRRNCKCMTCFGLIIKRFSKCDHSTWWINRKLTGVRLRRNVIARNRCWICRCRCCKCCQSNSTSRCQALRNRDGLLIYIRRIIKGRCALDIADVNRNCLIFCITTRISNGDN